MRNLYKPKRTYWGLYPLELATIALQAVCVCIALAGTVVIWMGV